MTRTKKVKYFAKEPVEPSYPKEPSEKASHEVWAAYHKKVREIKSQHVRDHNTWKRQQKQKKVHIAGARKCTNRRSYEVKRKRKTK